MGTSNMKCDPVWLKLNDLLSLHQNRPLSTEAPVSFLQEEVRRASGRDEAQSWRLVGFTHIRVTEAINCPGIMGEVNMRAWVRSGVFVSVCVCGSSTWIYLQFK